ncbi:hypothetical protein [Streptomyces aureoversilis]|uniref:Uncharacterized protein n=1 Tax=Streptomyces aureoversilis TaxID=67277 RepID=A0ABW0A6T0_9ACTN
MTTTAPSHVYYFEVGTGVWRGTFTFRVTSWRRFLRARGIGAKNRLLVIAMGVTQWLTGASRLDSAIVAKPCEGAFGEADNTVRISKADRGALAGELVCDWAKATEKAARVPAAGSTTGDRP